MTDEQKIQRLTDVISSLQEEISLRERVRLLQDKSFEEYKSRTGELQIERDNLWRENLKMHFAVKRGRYAVTAKERAKFDKSFKAVMEAK